MKQLCGNVSVATVTAITLAMGLSSGSAAECVADPGAEVRQMMIDQYDRLAPVLMSRQRTQPDSETDPNGILVGQFMDTFNCRKQEGLYILAYLYQEEQSKYYHNDELLNRVVLNLDYMCRAQGRNGGFNEYAKQGGWCGVQLPRGGNHTRKAGKSSVVGFTLYCIGRSIVILMDEPAFLTRLAELIDNDGDGAKDVRRRNAYMYLLDDRGHDGPLTGAMTFLHGNGRGHAPNQDTGALAAVHAVNEAYVLLTEGTRLRTQKQIEALRDEILFSGKWFSKKGMLLESGHGGRGYDANYGVVTLHTLGAYAVYAHDKVTADFIGKFMEGYHYFFVLDERWPKGAFHVSAITRRSGANGLPVFSAGLAQDYHESLKVMYAAGLRKLRTDPSAFFHSGGHLFQIDAVRAVDLLLNWHPAKPTDYALPCNSKGTFVYRDYNGPDDPQANIEVTKTGEGPETITWKAYDYDGGEKSFTYEPPSIRSRSAETVGQNLYSNRWAE